MSMERVNGIAFTEEGREMLRDIVREELASREVREVLEVRHTRHTEAHYSVSRSSTSGGVGVTVSVTGTNLEEMADVFGKAAQKAWAEAAFFAGAQVQKGRS